MAATKKTELTFKIKYRSADSNEISPDFTYTSTTLLTTLSPLYHSRNLRKYDAMDPWPGFNTFHFRLYQWPMTTSNTYIVQKPMDCLWALKILFYHKYNPDPEKESACTTSTKCACDSTDLFIIILCFVSGFAYFVQCLCILLLESIVAFFIFTAIQWLSFAIAIVLWKVIIYFTKSEPCEIIEPELRSRYQQKIKIWKSKYNNLPFIKFIKLLFLAPNNKPVLYKEYFLFLFLFIIWIIFPIVPVLNAYLVSSANFGTIKMKWVIPDYYDIQEDIKFFILNKLPKSITVNDELMHCIYHILNAVVAYEIDRRIMPYVYANRVGYNNDFFKNMRTMREIKESYLLCLEKYLKNKSSIFDKYNGINDEHSFDFKETCMKDYEYYQQINGYNLKYISINNGYFKRFIGFMFGNAYSHKYTFPLLFVFIFMNMTALVMSWYMRTVNTALIIVFSFPFCLWIFLFALFIWDFVKYLSEFQRVTKNIIFWMDPQLLLCFSKVTFQDRKNSFIPSIVQRSIKLITHFLNDLNQNNIYYDTFMERMNAYDYPFSDDITQIILDFVCECNNSNEYMNAKFKSYRYDSGVLQNKMDEMIQNGLKMYKTDCLNITINEEKMNGSNNEVNGGQMTVPLLNNTDGLRYMNH